MKMGYRKNKKTSVLAGCLKSDGGVHVKYILLCLWGYPQK